MAQPPRDELLHRVTQTAGRFRALDACRGFCAVLVVLFHLPAATHFHDWPIIRNGYVAVDFFFVLSGFVIASAYGDRIATASQAARFAVRRFGRLYPLHLAVVAVYVGVQFANLADEAPAFEGAFSLAALGQHVALVQGFTAQALTWNYPAWSISIELWVNLAFGAYVLILGRRAIWASLALVLFTVVFYLSAKALALPVTTATLKQWTVVAQSVFGFVLGTLVYQVYIKTRLHSWRPGLLAEALAVVAIILIFAERAHFHALLSPLMFAGVVWVLAYDAGPVSAFFHRRPWQALGAVSYSVYLTHALYLMAFDQIVNALADHLGRPASALVGAQDLLILGGPWVMDLAGLACVAGVIAGSLLTYRFIEEPARRYFNRLSGPLVPPTSTSASNARWPQT